MSLPWRQLDKGVWTTELPNRVDLYVEEVYRSATGERYYEAKVMDHG